jgi:hypothetical protein
MQTSYRWRLHSSPAGSHELLNMELSWAWEPMHSSGACSFGASTRSHCRVLDRNMAGRRAIRKITVFLNFDNKFVVKSRNKGGGLCLLWKGVVNARVQSFSNSHIDVIINETLHDAWRLTGFYGAPETHRRGESWDLLRRLKTHPPFLGSAWETSTKS